MSKQVQSDFIKIKSNLTEQINALEAQIEKALNRINALQIEHQSINENMQNYQGDIAHALQFIEANAPTRDNKQEELKHAVGTSLEAGLQSELNALNGELSKASATLKTYEDSLVSDQQAARSTTDAIATERTNLQTLQAKHEELCGTRARFDEQHREDVRNDGVARLNKAKSDIINLEIQLQAARAMQDQAQQQLAKDLSEWPSFASEVLQEHGVFPLHPAVRALKLKQELVQVIEENYKQIGPVASSILAQSIPVQTIQINGSRAEYEAVAARRREMHGSFVSSSAYHVFDAQMKEIERMVREITQEYNRDQAASLVKQ